MPSVGDYRLVKREADTSYPYRIEMYKNFLWWKWWGHVDSCSNLDLAESIVNKEIKYQLSKKRGDIVLREYSIGEYLERELLNIKTIPEIKEEKPSIKLNLEYKSKPKLGEIGYR